MIESILFADVIVDITLEKLNHTFQYIVPKHLKNLSVGDKVIVPFSNRKIEGIILSFSKKEKVDISKLKEIISISNTNTKDNIDKNLIILSVWMSSYFGATLNQTLKTVFPTRKKVTPYETKIIKLNSDLTIIEEYRKKLLSRKNHSIEKERLLDHLLKEKELYQDIITRNLHIRSSTIKDLEKNKILTIERYTSFRDPIKNIEVKEKNIELNDEQKSCISKFLEHEKEKKPYLLFGVTGSGKTEVYLDLIERNLKKGKDAIVLIPEISLTYQTVIRFYRRFGKKVSFIHSRMSINERYDQIDRARKGDIKIIIGPRSAIFTPFKNIGLIIVDEEHERSYKSENNPRYHAVLVAIKRAMLEGASIVLGSATPSIESFYHAKKGDYILLTLKYRANGKSLPDVFVTDLKEELKKGNRSIFGKELFNAMKECFNNKKQCMLFLNRRGVMSTILCRKCGYVIKCTHCDVSLTLHSNNRLICHYCGYERKNILSCPKCDSHLIGTIRAGTEYVEREVKRFFPDVKVLRMDRDTVRKKGDYEKILTAFHNREADVLIGTQMIAKGHDFSFVTLMGIILADLSLNASNFRAAERTFDLLVQASGRAGRGEDGEDRGKVFIQTYNPTNYAIKASIKQDYISFYNEEINYRRSLNYPPFGNILKILFEAKNLSALEKTVINAALFLKEIKNDDEIVILGPEDDTISKINDIYRKAIYIKSKKYDKLINIRMNFSEGFIKKYNVNNVVWWFDYNMD